MEDEGCLSLQDVLVPVERPVTVTIEGVGVQGEPVRFELAAPAVPRRPARAGPPRRHPDHRSHERRSATRGARDAQAAAGPRRTLSPRIAVAATAPFGADVLVRLAERHDVSCLLTRPDAPAGRGRKLAPSPAKRAATRLGIPGARAGAPRTRPGARRAGGRRRRVRTDRPGRPARRLPVAQRPSLAPSALARGGTGRTVAAGRGRGDGRHDHPTRARARRRPDRGTGVLSGRRGRRRRRRLRPRCGGRSGASRRGSRRSRSCVPRADRASRATRRRSRRATVGSTSSSPRRSS